MKYYEVAIVGARLSLLTYQSDKRVEIGTFVEVSLRRALKEAVIIKEVEKPDFKSITISKITPRTLSKQYIKIAEFIAYYYFCTIGEVLALFHPIKADNTLKTSDFTTQIVLSSQQQEALDFAKERGISLLFGDTGSGKTEIYMKWFEELIKEGKSALFLMPEISLTPQIEKRLKEHFGDLVAIWHSKITKKSKEKILLGLASGEIKIVAGARSSLFLTLPNLGLIVVDEEHDDSYKSSSRPRYHARDIALYMGKSLNIPVLLGSATPAATSYHKFPHYRLSGQYFDAKKKYVLRHSNEELPDALALKLLRENLDKKEQSIIFSPTRANFKYLVCQSCGKTVECPFCSVGMSIHHAKHILRCHYCNYAEKISQICPSCHTTALHSKRTGTGEIKLQLEQILNEATIEQFDTDTISTQKKLKEALKRFNDCQTDILVGTQMLSKGHNYHSVTFALILGLDYLLHTADYRASERTLALLMQIAGRAGRKKDAVVIIQSLNNDFFHQYLNHFEAFIKDELEIRKELYPPFTKLARLLFAHKNPNVIQEEMHAILNYLTSIESVQVVGSGSCAIEKIAEKYRYQILLRSTSSSLLLKTLYNAPLKMAEVDIDPVQFS
jgi:primosomal protein N' (replication factor Y) (superfamily II helicase)